VSANLANIAPNPRAKLEFGVWEREIRGERARARV